MAWGFLLNSSEWHFILHIQNESCHWVVIMHIFMRLLHDEQKILNIFWTLMCSQKFFPLSSFHAIHSIPCFIPFIFWGGSLGIKNSMLQGSLKINIAYKVVPRVVTAQNTIQEYIQFWPRHKYLTYFPMSSWWQDFSCDICSGEFTTSHIWAF